MMDNSGFDVDAIQSGADAFGVIGYALQHMSEVAAAELAWDLVEGKGEREIAVRVAHELRRWNVPVRREAERVDLIVAGRLRVEFKVIHIGSIYDEGNRAKLWGLGVFDKDLDKDKGDLHKLKTGQADLLVAAIPAFFVAKHNKYWKRDRVGPDELEGRLDTYFGDLSSACERWAEAHGIAYARREQIELQGSEDIDRVQLNLFGFTREENAG